MRSTSRTVFGATRCVAAILVLCVCVRVPVHAETVVMREVFPPNIQLSTDVRATVTEMLRSSETFRNQYARVLQAPLLVLRASVDLTLTDRAFRARSRIARYRSGLVIVTMQIGPGDHRAQWIAHEFEHVVEFLDGLDVRTLNERGTRGVWRVGAMFETERAARVGLTVGTEMRRQRHNGDNFGE